MTNQGKNAIDLLLAESFKELAATRPIEKITIKEITDKAGVIRPTFYNHFQDKYELLECIVQKELIEPMKPLIENGMVTEGVTCALSTMLKEKTFYLKAVKLEGQNSFNEVLHNAVSKLILEYLTEEEVAKKLPYEWLTPERAADFFAESLCYAVIEWIQTGMEIPMNEIVETFIYMTYHSIVDMIS